MNWTAQQIETAFGMTGITLENDVIVEGTGLDLTLANQRLQNCLAKSSLTPDAESYQVRAWLIRNGINPADIPALIASLTAPGAERDEALMRWEYAVRVPFDHPLVAAIAQQLNLNVSAIWFDILDL
jgi:hypothetical protein